LLNHFGNDLLPSDLANSDFPKSQVLLVGYAKGEPMWVEITFDHDTRRFVPPTVEELEYSPTRFKIFSGSIDVWKIMDDSELIFKPANLNEAAEEVGEYVQRCINGRYTFPDCKGIGGRVCLVAVTPNGFTWIPWLLGG